MRLTVCPRRRTAANPKTHSSSRNRPAEQPQRQLARTLGEALMTPTRIYVKPLLSLGKQVSIHAMAHITGGGIPGNTVRIIPDGLVAQYDYSAWEVPAIFKLIQNHGNVPEDDMRQAFNLGIGLVVVVAADDVQRALDHLTAAGETGVVMGEVVKAA